MRDGISNPRKEPSKAGRAAGRKNLAGWRSRARQRASELDAEVSAFRSGLLRDAGANPSASRIGLIEAAAATFAGILRARHAVVNCARSDVETLTERVSWLTGNLSRLLKQLNLDARPRPRCLADLSPTKVAPNAPIETATPPDSRRKVEEIPP